MATRRTRPTQPATQAMTAVESDASTPFLAQLAGASKGQPFLKWWHYFSVYDEQLGALAERSRNGELDRPIRLLEIGVWRGGSLELWRRYFGDDAVVFGIDIDPESARFGVTAGEIRIGSQTDRDFLLSVVDEMGGLDVVIDDGSHRSQDVIASLRILYPLLAENGRYIIEDLHTSYWPDWGGGLRRQGSSIEALKELVDVLHQPYFDRPAARTDLGIGRDWLFSVQFYDSVAVLHKRSMGDPRPFHGGDQSLG